MRLTPLLAMPLLAAGLISSGCATHPRDFARAPHMTPVGSGLASHRPNLPVKLPPADPRVTTGSLWRETSVGMFKDPRARRIGDTLTVQISIKDKASIDSQSDRSRTATRDFSSGFQYDIGIRNYARSGSGDANANVDSGSTHKGQGATSRSETIELLVAAVVTQRLANGNLVISGTQEVRVNFEVRVLTVSGIVRPRDISSGNSISYDKIAEARISYGGRGRIMEVQQPGWGQQLLDLFSPF